MSINEFDKYVKMPAITISEEWPSFCVRNCADVGIPVCEKNDANISSDEQTHAHTCSHKVCRTEVLSDVCVCVVHEHTCVRRLALLRSRPFDFMAVVQQLL